MELTPRGWLLIGLIAVVLMSVGALWGWLGVLIGLGLTVLVPVVLFVLFYAGWIASGSH